MKKKEGSSGKNEPAHIRYGKSLCKYAWRGNLKRCQRCLRKGGSAVIEYDNPLALSRPLHRACLGGHIDVVKWLVEENKASVSARDEDEWTPLHFAASKGFEELCSYLLSRGAHVDAKDSAGNTALHLAAGKDHINVVEALLAGAANIEEKNAAGKMAGEVASSRRVARAIAGLTRDLEEEKRENQRLLSEAALSNATEQPAAAGAGEFFDATNMYDLYFSSQEEVD